jgi:hypothetical protein
LHNAGKISATVAKELAYKEYDKFKIKQDKLYQSDNTSNKLIRSVIIMKKIKLDNFELKVIINSLNEMKSKLLNQNNDILQIIHNKKKIDLIKKNILYCR